MFTVHFLNAMPLRLIDKHGLAVMGKQNLIITKRENDFGGGDNFLDFLEEELIPELDLKYRTQP